MATVKFKPSVKCNFRTGCVPDDERAAEVQGPRTHQLPAAPQWVTQARARSFPPQDPLQHCLFSVEPCSSTVQSAKPRWELWMFFLSIHGSPFIFQLPERHVHPDRETISKSLYQPGTPGTQARLSLTPLPSPYLPIRRRVTLGRARASLAPCSTSRVGISKLPRSTVGLLSGVTPWEQPFCQSFRTSGKGR